MSLFDPDGDLPLNLQRDKVIGGIASFRDELLEGVVFDLIAYGLVMGPERTRASSEMDWMSGKFPGFRPSRWGNTFNYRPLWAVGRDGFTLNHPRIFEVMKIASVFTAFVRDSSNPLSKREFIGLLNKHQLVKSVGYFQNTLNPTKSCLSTVLSSEDSDRITDVSGVFRLGHRTIIQQRAVGRVLDARVLGRGLRAKIEDASIEKQNQKWNMLKFGDCPPLGRKSLLDRLMTLDPATAPMAFTEVHIDPEKTTVESNPVVNHWLDTLEDPLIPWSVTERRKKFAAIYDELEPYIQHWEEEKKKPDEENDDDD